MEGGRSVDLWEEKDQVGGGRQESEEEKSEV